MDRFQEMQVFVRIADRGSFSLAAQDLQIPRSTVTNLIKRLEQRLGARLLARTTRQVSLTQEGAAYYQRCVRLLADLDEADSLFRTTALSGVLRVNLQGTLARHFVLPGLGDFMARHPGLTLHIGEDDRLIDLVREGVDCVLRAGTPQDSTLIAWPLALLDQVTVASPAYLRARGLPQRLSDLDRHCVVAFVSSVTGRPMPLEFWTGKEVVQRQLAARVSVTGADGYTGAALAGAGLIQVPGYRIQTALEQGDLVVVLPNLPPPPMRVSLMYPHSRQLSMRVRVFRQWLEECFAQPI